MSSDSANDRLHLTFTYDANDNRTNVTTHVLLSAVGNDDVETTQDSSRYFTYDAMNRQTAVDAVDSAGNISATQGHQLSYDLDGNRKTDRYWGNKVTTTTQDLYIYDETTGQPTYVSSTPTYTKSLAYVTDTYGYDAMDRLQTVDRDGTLVDTRLYDGAGRVVQSGPSGLPSAYVTKLNEGVPVDQQIGMLVQRQLYDADGRLQFQRVFKSDGSTKMSRQIVRSAHP